MAFDSPYLSSFVSLDRWNEIVMASGSASAAQANYAAYVDSGVWREGIGVPGASTWESLSLVAPGIPTARANMRAPVKEEETRVLPTASGTFVDYAAKDVMRIHEFLRMVSEGTLESYVDRLQQRNRRAIIAQLANFMDNVTDSSVAPIPSTSGTGSDALAATHTLLDGSTTWDNDLGTALTHDNVSDAYETMVNDEVDAQGVKTGSVPTILAAGFKQRREVLQAIGSEVTSAANQIGVLPLRPALLPTMTSSNWFLVDGENSPLVIAYAGGLPDALLPDELRGLEVGHDGMPWVDFPIWDPETRTVTMVYRTMFVLVATGHIGFLASTP